MAYAIVPIYTQTVGSGGAASIAFNNIPSTYTDILVKVSVRSSTNADPSFYWSVNGDGSANYSLTRLSGTGSAASSTRQTGLTFFRFDGGTNGTSETANTFNALEIYIPNYRSSSFKQMTIDSTAENNATAADAIMSGALWRNTNPITSLGFSVDGTIAQNSTFSLYGIKQN